MTQIQFICNNTNFKIVEAFNQYLQQFPHYTPAAFEKVKPYLSQRTLEAGEFWLQPGTVCRHIAFIETGLLRLFYLHEGKEITHCFCKEQTLTTSYSSLISQQESDIAIQAIEPSTLFMLPYQSLQHLYAEDLFWQQVGRLAAETEYLQTASHNRFLRDLSATDRYLHILAHDKALLQRVPLTYLASYLQIAPETLSRIRNKIART